MNRRCLDASVLGSSRREWHDHVDEEMPMSASHIPGPCCQSGSDCCGEFHDGWLRQDVADELAVTFNALSDPVRLRMLSFLSHAAGGATAAGDLVACVCRSQPTVSHHLQVLHSAGLVTRARDGSHVRYAIDRERLAAVLDVEAIVHAHD